MRKDKVITQVLGDETVLSPSDIHTQECSESFIGGYDKAEVRQFLARVADTVEAMVGQVRSLKEQIDDSRAKMEEYIKMEEAMRMALVSSQRFSEEVIEIAKREAHTLLQEARLSRAQASLEAAKLPGALSRDIKLLEQQRQRLRVEIMSILETHRKLLDSLVPDTSARGLSSFFEVADEPQLRNPGSQVSFSMEDSVFDSGAKVEQSSAPGPEVMTKDETA